jgi:ketosteroid isomerase-like protein
MSAENVEVAKRGIAAFNAREVEGFASLTTPDFIWYPSMGAIEGQAFEGRPGIERYFATLANAWESFQIVPGEFRTLGNTVVMLGRLDGLGKGSGVPVDSSLGMVFDLRGGAISRIRGFLDHAETLRAAGLEE